MARMYSRRKGKSGSRKPAEKSAPWVKYKPEEIEAVIIKLAREGHHAGRIGLILRDQYGIPDVRTAARKKVSRIVKENRLQPKLPDDLLNLLKKAVGLYDHLGKNRRDYTSQRGLELTESKIRRLVKYYKREKVLPADWKYDPEAAKLLVK